MTTCRQIIMILMMSPLKVLRVRYYMHDIAFGKLGMLLSIVRFGFVASLGQEKPSFWDACWRHWHYSNVPVPLLVMKT
ncbi:hypothetical protein CsSME_00035237 [Camellia sinensis var. sinensis]